MNRGFSLTELLIALGILGIIATLTIPKILNANQANTFNVRGREAVSMIINAYTQHKTARGITPSTRSADLTPYMHFLATDNTSTIDAGQGTSTVIDCSVAGYHCLKLHTGGLLFYRSDTAFGNNKSTNAIYFYFDPDGKHSGTGNSTGPGKSALLMLYYDGELRSFKNVRPNSICSAGCGTGVNPTPAREPDWLKWN